MHLVRWNLCVEHPISTRLIGRIGIVVMQVACSGSGHGFKPTNPARNFYSGFNTDYGSSEPLKTPCYVMYVMLILFEPCATRSKYQSHNTMSPATSTV